MRLEEDITLLRGLDLFRCFEPDALRILAFSVQRRALRAGDVLFRRGDAADGGILIASGSVTCDQSDDGRPSDLEFGRGVLIGELALFTEGERVATFVVRQPGQALFISRELMTRVLEAHPATAARVQDHLSLKAAQTALGLEALSQRLG